MFFYGIGRGRVDRGEKHKKKGQIWLSWCNRTYNRSAKLAKK